MSIHLGGVIALNDKSALERVLWADPSDGSLVTFSLTVDDALPIRRSRDELLDAASCGLLFRDLPDEWRFLISIRDDLLEPKHVERRERNWRLILPLVEDQPRIFEAEARGEAIRVLEGNSGVDRVQIYRLLRRFWGRGMTANALLPGYAIKKFKERESRDVSRSKAGRPPKGRHAMSLDDAFHERLRLFATRVFAKNRQMTMANAYTDFLGVFYATGSDNANREDSPRLASVYPNERQFTYHLAKLNNSLNLKRSRVSSRVYDLNMRGLVSTSSVDVDGPGSRYQVDATILDVYVTSRFNRHKIVGRPTLYIIIDVFTRMIVGIYVGIEPPSWVGVMQALVNTVTDKVKYCARFGIEVRPEDWPNSGFPQRLLADRGEMLGARAETLANNFHIKLETTAPYRADWKGVVERRFGLLPAKFGPYVPGFVQPDFQKRGATDYRLDAALSIDEITAVIINCVVHYNSSHPLSQYQLTGRMAEDDLIPIPSDLWRWGIANLSGAQRAFDEGHVQLALLPGDEATITPTGVRFRGCFYSGAIALEHRWFDRARQGRTSKIQITYDPRDMSQIYHLHEGKFHSFDLTERSRQFTGMSLVEVSAALQTQKQRLEGQRHEALESEVRLNKAITDIVGAAVSEKPKIVGQSKATRTKSIRENRAAETKILQGDAAIPKQHRREPRDAEILAFPGQPLPQRPSSDLSAWLAAIEREDDQ